MSCCYHKRFEKQNDAKGLHPKGLHLKTENCWCRPLGCRPLLTNCIVFFFLLAILQLLKGLLESYTELDKLNLYLENLLLFDNLKDYEIPQPLFHI